jgi:glutamate synthase domain-containing protein 2
MVRTIYYLLSAVSLAVIAGVYFYWPPVLFFLILVLPLIGLGIYDIISRHNVLSNYPVIGHLRYFFEFISPEIRQYFLEDDRSGRPYNRQQRNLVNARADGTGGTHPFGTEFDIRRKGYDFAYHSIGVKQVPEEAARIVVGGPHCRRPYSSSRLNISAMSFGSLSSRAVLAMNQGAKLGGFAQDTGEGGLTPYHLRYGADVIWEIGSGYFSARAEDGRFDEALFKKGARRDEIKMIEIKLSQGAKPGHGGVLPGAKVNAEIARIRGVPIGKDCISPAVHPEFSTPHGLIGFIVRLRELSGGKPVGFKLCIGRRSEFMAIVKAMLETGVTPDFITVDGAEGGTGAAPVEYSDNFGMSIDEALVFVRNCLVGAGLRDKIRIIASGKIVTGFDMVTKIALGADLCNVARPMMFAVGCIQALRCDTGTCPTGVTTQDPRRVRALNVDTKAVRVKNFHHATVKSFLSLTGAMGIAYPDELTPDRIMHRLADGPAVSYDRLHECLAPDSLLGGGKLPFGYAEDWRAASAEEF